MPADEIDGCIDAANRRLGEFSQADRCSILLFADDGKIMKLAHEYCAPGMTSQRIRFQHVELVNFPWLKQFTHSDEPIRIADASKLPSDARTEATLLNSTGAMSLIAYPLLFGGSFLGFIGFVSTTRANAFAPEHEDLIALTSPLFVHSLQRKKGRSRHRETGGLSQVQSQSRLGVHAGRKAVLFQRRGPTTRAVPWNSESARPQGKAPEDWTHSKPWRKWLASRTSRERLGVRSSSAALWRCRCGTFGRFILRAAKLTRKPVPT